MLHADQRKRLKYLQQISGRLYQQFQDNLLWTALAALADSLLVYETLDQEQIEEVLLQLLGD